MIMDNDNDNQKPAEVHVSNLSKNVKYGHLKEIFGYYGNIKNIDMNYNNNSANIIIIMKKIMMLKKLYYIWMVVKLMEKY